MRHFFHRATFLMMIAGLFAQIVLLAEVSPTAKAEIGKRLESLLHVSPTDEVDYQMRSYFRTLSLSEIAVTKDWLTAAKPSVERKIAFESMIVHWARLDGPAAYAFARSQTVLGI